MKNYFIHTPVGREGPFTLEDLKKKNLKRSTLIWCYPMKDWMPAGELPELEELFSMIPPDVKSGAESKSRPAPPGPTQIMPRTWLVESILVMVFCCFPFGLVGLVYAARVDSRFYQGDYAGAEQASREAGRWTKIGFWLTIAFYLVILILTLIGVTAGIFASIF
ncbi:MAG: CD225/dispanin family protein [Bacteroidales bacterium]